MARALSCPRRRATAAIASAYRAPGARAPVTLRQLEYLLAVVDERSFTRAAIRLKVAQPSLSQQIRALEGELGVQLIERLPRDVRPTLSGRALLPHARSAVASAERAARAARTAGVLAGGALEIATVRSLVMGMLPDAIRAWREVNQGTLRLHEYAHRDLLEESVRNGVGDLGVGPTPKRWEGPLVPLGWQGFVVVLALSDPLAATRAPLRLAQLADRDWVLFEPEHGLLELLLAACAAAGFAPRGAVETSQVDAAARLAAAGLGPALVPERTVPADLRAAVMPVDPPVGHEIAAYARAPSPAASAFVEYLKAQELPRRPPGAIEIR
jgi:DNA-binding transcriptional LysR family regulator